MVSLYNFIISGNTPQRKEFSYPRNILQFSNKKSELAKHIQAAENNVIDEDLVGYTFVVVLSFMYIT